MKESFHSCGIRRRASPSMIKIIISFGLALMSSRRILIKRSTTFPPWMGEICHYQWMGLFYEPIFKELDFLRAQAPGK
jgi:hypothetical protein